MNISVETTNTLDITEACILKTFMSFTFILDFQFTITPASA